MQSGNDIAQVATKRYRILEGCSVDMVNIGFKGPPFEFVSAKLVGACNQTPPSKDILTLLAKHGKNVLLAEFWRPLLLGMGRWWVEMFKSPIGFC
jgi:hypothetical protein